MLLFLLLAAIANAQGETVTINSFGTYPGTADSTVTGTVTLTFSATGATLDWDLAGVDSACASGGTGGNSCGIHIHAGTSCIDHNLVEGHYYNSDTIDTDPWTTSFTSSDDGTTVTSSGSATVEYGYGYADTIGKTLVIHDEQAARVTCTVIHYTETVVTIPTWSVYPGYTGDIVLGTGNFVTLGFVEDSVAIAYSLEDGDAACTQAGSEPNSCGIHIHSGTSCVDASLVGGHYYNSDILTTDPWSDIVYTPDESGGYVASRVTTGYTYADSEGRAFVVHGLDGGRVACALINKEETTTTLSSIGQYPGNSEDSVGGTVTLGFVDSTVSISYDLTGIDSQCTEAGDQANSCGIHIHSGNSCIDASLVGGHYYDSDNLTTDPWSDVVYVTTEGTTTATGAVQVDMGYTSATGLAFVTHNYDGSRASCTLIGVDSEVVSIIFVADYPTWTGTSYTGSVNLEFVEDRVSIGYDLANVDSRCTQVDDASANSCGIHIHAGTSCIDHALVGGHYYDSDNLSSDPWSSIVFVAQEDGTAVGATQATYGYTAADSNGRAFVIHDQSGARATCNLIGQHETVVTIETPGTYPTWTGTAITGSVTLGFVGESVSMAYNLANVDSACTTTSSEANSCGIHIHAGLSCATHDDVGGHYYDFAGMTTDPWANIAFVTSSGTDAVGVVPAVNYGKTYDESADRAFVIHDQSGARVSCALIEDTSAASAPSFALALLLSMGLVLFF